MTRQELADKINISRQTLNAWEKEKPELVRLINQGLAMDELLEEAENNLNKLKELKKEASDGKFKLK